MKNINNLAWLDMEMTGLDPEHDRILEVAIIITDSELNILAQSPILVVHQSDELLNSMDAWNTSTHGRNGLTDKVRASTLTECEVEKTLLQFLKTWLPEKASPLCGNTVHQDRRFMVRYMPHLEAYFHYRNLDVSTLKELARRWRPDLIKGFTKKNSHQAYDDIIESIEEMRYYRDNFLMVNKDIQDLSVEIES